MLKGLQGGDYVVQVWAVYVIIQPWNVLQVATQVQFIITETLETFYLLNMDRSETATWANCQLIMACWTAQFHQLDALAPGTVAVRGVLL
jgi:hypothetical protein